MVDKSCENCNNSFTPTGRTAKYCPSCRKIVNRRAIDAYRLRKGVRVGIGSGNAQGFGENHHSFKNGISVFIKFSKTARTVIRYCERCSKDLLNAGPFYYVVHHRDHNRDNNCIENFELLCKRCHQLEHDCYKAFSKVQRLSLRGVENSVLEAPVVLPQQDKDIV